MGEKIFDLISKIATGKKRRVFWAVVIIILVATTIIFPYIDANYLYYSRMEKRLDNLGKLIEISGTSISDSPELQAEYHSILNDVSLARERNILGGLTKTESQGTDYWIKFFGGGLLFALVGLLGLFSGKKNLKMTFSLFLKNNLTVFIGCSIFASILAYIFAHVPTLGSAYVNAILSPFIQLIVLYLLLQPTKEKEHDA